MASNKRNTFLDAGDSDEDDSRSYDSEAEVVTKGGHSAKRRKLAGGRRDDGSDDDHSDAGQSDDGQSGDEEGSDDEEPVKAKGTAAAKKQKKHRPTKASEEDNGSDANDDDEDDDDDDEDGDKDDRPQPEAKDAKKSKKKAHAAARDSLPGVDKPLSKKNLVASEKAVRRSGVVYLSRIPPYMKPAKLRTLLAPYGQLNRIFLAPEDPAAHARRVRAGGNKRRSFVEGWVEFVRKRDARRAADLLNAQTIGGKKTSYYHDDLWSLVYLRGFKWHHLTEQIATENAERASRMRAEIAQTTRENKAFLQNLERAKMLDGMEAKAAAKGGKDKAEGDKVKADKTEAAPAPTPDGTADDKKAKRVRSFRQTRLVARDEPEVQPEHVQRVLSKIF